MENQTQKIHLTKEFPVGKQKLYNAWVEPSELKQWWKPLEKQLTNIQNDVTKGGKVHYGFEDGDLEINGEYQEVIENEKLVYTWNWELPKDSVNRGEYLLRIQFKGDNNNSSLEVTQESFKEEHAIQPHQEGWENALEDLKNYLTGK
jgi:uncharacterized protein YndB with AHSA1/START domain